MTDKIVILKRGYILGLISRPFFIFSIMALFNDNAYISNLAILPTFVSSYLYSKYFHLTDYIKDISTLKDFQDELIMLGADEKDILKFYRKL